MHRFNRSTNRATQKGTALLVALLFLIGITLLSLAGINTSILELRMARNTEASMNTFQTAVAALDNILSDTNNLPTTGPLNTPQSVTLPATLPFTLQPGETITASAVRILDCAPPPRARLASSLTSFSAFQYEAEVTIDKNATGNSRTGLAQGYQLLGPNC